MNIFETTVLCKNCRKEMKKEVLVRDNFKLRALVCPGCNERWIHPEDMHEYDEYKRLKEKDFQVKLRMVGNSYAVSIPREIIQYTEMRREGHLVKMSMEGPEKIILSFSKVTKKVYTNHRRNKDDTKGSTA